MSKATKNTARGSQNGGEGPSKEEKVASINTRAAVLTSLGSAVVGSLTTIALAIIPLMKATDAAKGSADNAATAAVQAKTAAADAKAHVSPVQLCPKLDVSKTNEIAYDLSGLKDRIVILAASVNAHAPGNGIGPKGYVAAEIRIDGQLVASDWDYRNAYEKDGNLNNEFFGSSATYVTKVSESTKEARISTKVYANKMMPNPDWYCIAIAIPEERSK